MNLTLNELLERLGLSSAQIERIQNSKSKVEDTGGVCASAGNELLQGSLGGELLQHCREHQEKAERSELKYCEDHDREFYDFEFEGMCPICYEEKLWYDFGYDDHKSADILKRNGRFDQ